MAEQQFTLDGLILAGGRATRLGGVDKGLQPLDGQALIEWTLAPLRPLEIGRASCRERVYAPV